MERYLIRSSLTKDTPGTDDLLARELGYSFSSETLFLKYPDGSIRPIGGRKYIAALAKTNRLPDVSSDSASFSDYQNTLTGSVLSNDLDADADTFTVTQVSYTGVSRTVGTSFSTDFGSFTIAATGAWTFSIGAAGRALTSGQSATEVISYRVLDSRGGVSNATTLTVTITGTDQGPALASDTGALPAGVTSTGNVLSNDLDYEGSPLAVTNFRVAGDLTVYLPGQTATMSGVGQFTLASTGVWSFTPDAGHTGMVPVITYTASDGNNSESTTITLTVLRPPPTYQETIDWFRTYYTGQVTPTRIAPNPPPERRAPSFTTTQAYANWDYKLRLPDSSGSDATNLDFRVGPGMEYPEVGDVPWVKLLPGDRVFIYYRAAPYQHVIPVHVRGEPSRWVEIIGVRGPNGEMPVLDGTEAFEDPVNCKFNQTMSGTGMIQIIQPLDGSSGAGYKPGYVHIHGLEIRNIEPPGKLTNMFNAREDWAWFVSGIKAQGVDYLTVSGCYIHNCTLGMFINSTPGMGERFMSRYMHFLFNVFGDNGEEGDYSTHNCYVEGLGVIYEFNYFYPITAGCYGDLVKDRSSGQILRYNYFECGAANAVSLRDPEGSYTIGYTAVDSLGASLANSSYVYSNTFYLKSANIAVGHGDGDYAANNEVRGAGKVHFYGNRVVCKFDGTSGYVAGIQYTPNPASLFVPLNTRELVTFSAKNNLLYADNATPGGVVPQLAVFYWQGIPDMSSNFAHNLRPVYLDASTTVVGTLNPGTRYGGAMVDMNLTNVDTDPGFINYGLNNFSLAPSSPFYSLNAPDDSEVIARGLQSQGDPVAYPFHDAPVPQMFAAPSVSGLVVVGSLLTGMPAVFDPNPTSSTYAWKVDGVTVSTSLTYTPVEADAGKQLTFSHTGSNEKGSATGVSIGYLVGSATTPQVTAAPAITGSRQVEAPLQVSTGAWTNSPTTFSYEWIQGSSTLIPGETSSTYTPDASKLGLQVRARVKAQNAGGEFNFAESAAVTIIAASADPDPTGKFNFSAVNGTSIGTLDAKWQGTNLSGAHFARNYFFCNGSGALASGYVGKYTVSYVWYENGQSDNVSVEVGWTMNETSVGRTVGPVLRASSTQGGYLFEFSAAQLRIFRNSTLVHTVGHSLTGAIVARVVPSGGVFNVYTNGSLLTTYTDSTPLTGGFPGLHLNPGENELQTVDYWTDSPA